MCQSIRNKQEMKEKKEIRSQDFSKPFHQGIVVEAQRKEETGGHEDDTYPPHADSSAGRRMKHRPKPLRSHQEGEPETWRPDVRETNINKGIEGAS